MPPRLASVAVLLFLSLLPAPVEPHLDLVREMRSYRRKGMFNFPHPSAPSVATLLWRGPPPVVPLRFLGCPPPTIPPTPLNQTPHFPFPSLSRPRHDTPTSSTDPPTRAPFHSNTPRTPSCDLTLFLFDAPLHTPTPPPTHRPTRQSHRLPHHRPTHKSLRLRLHSRRRLLLPLHLLLLRRPRLLRGHAHALRARVLQAPCRRARAPGRGPEKGAEVFLRGRACGRKVTVRQGQDGRGDVHGGGNSIARGGDRQGDGVSFAACAPPPPVCSVPTCHVPRFSNRIRRVRGDVSPSAFSVRASKSARASGFPRRPRRSAHSF